MVPFLIVVYNDFDERTGSKGLIVINIKTILLPLALNSLVTLRENVTCPICKGVERLFNEGVLVSLFVFL